MVLCPMMQYSATVLGIYKQDIKTLQAAIKNLGPGLRSPRFKYWLHFFSHCVLLRKPLNLSELDPSL